MSKRRMLDTAIWSNDNFIELPPYGRLLQIGLIDFADDQGRCKGSPVYLRSLVFPGDTDHVNNEEIRRWLNVMVVNRTILIYQVEGRDYIQLLNWWKYQTLRYAVPSDYPAPEGWNDRICFNGKGNITLYHNWVKADGTEVEDTCDAQGKPLPFVSQLPRKNQGGRPGNRPQPSMPAEAAAETSQRGKEEEEKVGGNVPQNVYTFGGGNVDTFGGGNVDTFGGGNVPPNVNKEYKEEYKEEEEKGESNNNGADAPPAPSVPVVSLSNPSSKDHPTVRAYHGLHNRYPTRAQMAHIIKSDPPIADWVRAIRAWEFAGHNPSNIQGMLDWALEPSRFENASLPRTAGRGQASKASDPNDPARRAEYSKYNNFLSPLPKGKPS